MRWLRLRARSEVRGDDLSDILRDLGVPRTTFYSRTTALAGGSQCPLQPGWGDEQDACSHVERR
jgi:hypothetical protein